MIAVDANILIYAHRLDSAWHIPAKACIASLAEGRAPWAIPWPCLHEFVAIVTHPRIYAKPTALRRALDQASEWARSPSLSLIGETARHFEVLVEMASAAKISGPRIHDAKIAAICVQHGVSELWTADRDFSRFPAIKTRNPLIS